MKRSFLTCGLLVLGLTVGVLQPATAVRSESHADTLAEVAVPQPAPDGSGQDAESLIRQAREDGLAYLNTKDDKAKKSAKKNLEEAEKQLKESLKRDPNCEKCTENLVKVFLYQSYFGFSKDYDQCIKAATQAMARFPNNTQMAFLKGYAHYNAQDFSEAIKSFNRYLATSTGNAESEAQVQKLLQDSQQKFLNNWYKHANYYQSKDARIEAVGQNFKTVTLFQVTPEWELNLGSQAFAAVTQQSQTLQDPEVQTYVEKLVNRLVSKTPGPNYNYKVTILNSPTVNAMTVPGHVFVATGLIAYAENEAELVGVLAHEMAHNYGHHAARRFIKAYQAQNLANAIVSAVNPQNNVAQLVSQLAANIGVQLFVLAYNRGEEKEADLYGSHIMFNAGYDPTALSAFFARMYKESPKQPIKFLSTHPPMPDRATYMIDYVESYPLGSTEVKTDSEDFKKIKARLGAMMPQTQPKKGAGQGVLPPQ